VKRGGVGARHYVLHINKAYTVALHGDHLYLETTKIPYGDKTWCGRLAATVNGASTGCAYSKDELCIACLEKARSCKEIPA
jgi:hypothetical protein